MPSHPAARPQLPARPGAAHAALARVVARYGDRTPPSITDVRAAVAAFVAEFRLQSRSPEQMVVTLKACVDAHAPRRVDAGERLALTQLLVRWALEVHGLYAAAAGGRRRESAE